MPTYEYECKSCKHSFDVFQSIKDEPLKICPECGKELRRVINGGTGIIFKGGGFYVTDKGGNGGRPSGSKAPDESVKTGKTEGQKKEAHKTEAQKTEGSLGASSETGEYPKAANS